MCVRCGNPARFRLPFSFRCLVGGTPASGKYLTNSYLAFCSNCMPKVESMRRRCRKIIPAPPSPEFIKSCIEYLEHLEREFPDGPAVRGSI